MRAFGQFVLAVGASSALLGAQAPDRAAQVLADAQKALGGEKLALVRSFVANGRTKRIRGNNLVPIEFEMSVELPDKYLRKDEFPAEETDPTSAGFNGINLIQNPAPVAPPLPPAAAAAAGRAGAPPPNPAAMLDAQRKARVTTLKQDFVRMALGMFARSFDTHPLTFSYAAQAEAPQGTADVLDVKGDANFSLRLFVNSQTHLPIMVSWQLPPTNVVVLVPGQPPPPTIAPGAVVITGPAPPTATATTATPEEKTKYSAEVADLRKKAQATPVEHRLYFQNYQMVDGVQWPFKLRRAIGVDTTEETTFDRFRINVKIDPKKFEPVK